MSRHSDTSTQMAKIMVQHGRPSRSSWTRSLRSSFSRTTVMGKAIWESSIRTRMGKKFQIEIDCFSIVKKKIILVCVCGRHKNGLERSTTSILRGKFWWNTLNWENQHHSLIMFTWDALTDKVKQAKILWTITESCSNPEFLLEHLRNFLFQGNRSEHCHMVLWHGRSCKEMCGTTLRVGK